MIEEEKIFYSLETQICLQNFINLLDLNNHNLELLENILEAINELLFMMAKSEKKL